MNIILRCIPGVYDTSHRTASMSWEPSFCGCPYKESPAI